MQPPDDPSQAGAVTPGALIAEAREWLERRSAKEGVLELYVRMRQLMDVVAHLCLMHEIDMDLHKLEAPGLHPAPDPDELRAWLERLVPNKGEKHDETAQ